jgi:anti-anti-sigma factor
MARGVGMLENSGDRLQLCVKPGSQTTIEAEGELDYQNCDMLERMIKEIINTSDRVTLSLGSLNFVDSSGLRILVKAALDARKLDRTLRIDSLAPQLAHMLDVSDFGPLFEINHSQTVSEPDSPAYHFGRKAASFQIPLCMASCRTARNEVCKFAADIGLMQTALDDVRLAVGEAVSNAVRHGGYAENESIHIECRVAGGKLVITLKYPSTRFDPESIPVPNKEMPAEGGMGIYFMRIVMDKVEYDFPCGYVKVTMEKKL